MDKVSVIITTYKRKPEMVKRAVSSVLAQTYTNLEVIVVDDSPSAYADRKDVKAAITAMGDGVKYVVHEENQGACAARNTGIRNSEGDFVAFLDDDDEWLPEKLEKQMKLFDDAQIGLVYCLFWICSSAQQKTVYQNHIYVGNIYQNLLVDNFIGSTSVAVLRKSIAVQAGMFDVNLKSAQDIDMWIRCSKICKIDCVSEPLVNYYAHEGERITTEPGKKIQGMKRVFEKYQEDIAKNPEALWKRKMKMATMYSCNRQYKQAFSLYGSAVIRKPWRLHENLYYLKMIFIYMKSGSIKE